MCRHVGVFWFTEEHFSLDHECISHTQTSSGVTSTTGPKASLHPATTTPSHRCAVSLCHPPPPFLSLSVPLLQQEIPHPPPPPHHHHHYHHCCRPSTSTGLTTHPSPSSQKNKHHYDFWKQKFNFTSAKHRRWVLKADSRQPRATDVSPPSNENIPLLLLPPQLSCTSKPHLASARPLSS